MLGLKPSFAIRTFCCLKVSVVAKDSWEEEGSQKVLKENVFFSVSSSELLRGKSGVRGH